jgi:catechol 2,3-dioxygenase-like lactoylglutathione lyase family enzyme
MHNKSRKITALFIIIGCWIIFSNATAEKLDGNIDARFYHVAIHVRDLDRSIAFYKNVFGFSVLDRWSHVTFVDQDGNEKSMEMQAAFMKDDKGIVYEFTERKNSTYQNDVQGPINHISFVVADVSSSLEKAVAAGGLVSVDKSVVKVSNMVFERAGIQGPDGENIELIRVLK